MRTYKNDDHIVRQYQLKDLESNDQMNGHQASVTYKLKSQEGHVLAAGGETLAFAKRDLAEQLVQSNERLAALEKGLLEVIKNNHPENKIPENEHQRGQWLAREIPDLSAANKKIEGELKGLSGPDKEAFIKSVESYLDERPFNEQTQYSIGKGMAPASHLVANPDSQDDFKVAQSCLTRSVASSALDELIGTQSLSKESFGTVKVDERDVSVGVSVAVTGAPVFEIERVENSNGSVDEYARLLSVEGKNIYEDPLVQKGLYDLEVQDYLSGQVDRHCGNIFVDPDTKKVTGIDNDMAFPERDRESFHEGKSPTLKAVKNPPRYMHQDTADRILATTPEMLRSTLESVENPSSGVKLTKGQIDGVVHRLKQLQDHIVELQKEGRIVSEFTAAHYKDAIDDAMEVRAAALEMDSVRPVIFNTSYIGAIKNDEMTYTIDAEKNKQGSLQSTKVREAPKNEDYLEQQRRKQSMREQLLDKNPLKNPDTLTAKEEKVFACENEVKKLQDKLGDNAKAVKQSPSVLHQARDLFLHGDRNASLKANLEQRSEILQKLKAENEKLDGLLDQAIAERGFKIDKPQGQNEERTLTIGQQRLWDAANADQRAPQIEKIGAQRAGAKIGDALGGNQVPKEVGQGPAVHRQ